MKHNIIIALAFLVFNGCKQDTQVFKTNRIQINGADFNVASEPYEIPNSELERRCSEPPQIDGVNIHNFGWEHFEIPDTLTYAFSRNSTFNENSFKSVSAFHTLTIVFYYRPRVSRVECRVP